MKITDTPITFEDFLKDYTEFFIPVYQREYSWELEQLADLFYDISDTDPNPEKTGEGHFFGSILTHEKKETESKVGEIIDGQQRVTTIYLLLNEIKKKLYDHLSTNINEVEKSNINDAVKEIDSFILKKSKGFGVKKQKFNHIPKLKLGKRNKDLFENIINNKKLDPTIAKSENNLINASLFFSRKIEDYDVESLMNLLNQVVYSEIIVITSENNKDKMLLFKTLNHRGMELTQADLIKNEICNKTKGISIEDAAEIWEDKIRTELDKLSLNVDTFIFHYLNSSPNYLEIRKEIDTKNGKKLSKAHPYVSEKMIFEVLELKLDKIKNTKTFLNELSKNVNFYNQIINPEKNKKKIFKHLLGLKILKISKAYPILLKGKQDLDENNFVKLAKAIEIISFRHSIMRYDPKELEKLYYELIPLTTNSEINTLIKKIKEFKTIKDEKTFKSEFIKASPKEIISKYILFRITNAKQENLDWEDKNTIHLEHIMPKKVKKASDWEKVFNKDEDEYNNYVKRIGNHTLLDEKLNITASNKDFKLKKNDNYKKSRLELNIELVKKKTWNYKIIETRQAELYELVNKLEIWKL